MNACALFLRAKIVYTQKTSWSYLNLRQILNTTVLPRNFPDCYLKIIKYINTFNKAHMFHSFQICTRFKSLFVKH